jgi:hypothetical protein
MKLKAFSFALLIALFATGAAQSFAQSPDDENVRGSFLTTRPKTADKPTKSSTSTRRSRRRPTAATAKTSTTTTTTASSIETSPGKTTEKTEGDTVKKPAAGQRIGVGLTLFIRDSNGLAVRVDPNHDFHKGDRVRVLLETNVDGHLYIFNTTDGGDPVMIYPDVQLDEAGNFIQAHVPFEIPSSLASDERLRWFRFDEHAGAERLYFVFTREPLPEIPIEDDLVKYCGENKATCAWHPTAALWTRLQKELNAVKAAKPEGYGRAQTAGEREAATRGIGLARDDPEPSLVMMNASSASGLLITFLEMVHK